MKQRIYIDTSVIGGYYDVEFEAATKALFERLRKREILFVLSDHLFGELEGAPQKVKDLLLQYDDECFEYVYLTDEAQSLAGYYISENVVGRTSFDDCQHIAIATINKVDVLASWNFKHIVNLDKIRGYNGVNLKKGYSTIEIRNPKELINYEDD
jgi:hypothetical protein